MNAKFARRMNWVLVGLMVLGYLGNAMVAINKDGHLPMPQSVPEWVGYILFCSTSPLTLVALYRPSLIQVRQLAVVLNWILTLIFVSDGFIMLFASRSPGMAVAMWFFATPAVVNILYFRQLKKTAKVEASPAPS